MHSPDQRTRVLVIGTPIDAIDWNTALTRIEGWAQARESRYVCICNVHSLVTARQRPSFAHALAQADMATPDGAPVAWMLRRLGIVDQQRINGPDLMLHCCDRAQSSGVSVFLYGGTADLLDLLQRELRRRFPALRIAGIHAPPFRAPTAEESQSQIDEINRSGAGVVFVSLGCPKQELWMAERSGLLKAVTIGVGAAFAFHAGVTSRAPRWMHTAGLEWLHRLMQEPRRLWRRYLTTNSVFIVRAAIQLWQARDR